MRSLAIFALFLAGCSTAPVADLLDYFKPGKMEQGKVAPYGGVCGPQQVGATGPGAIITPPPFPGAGPALPGPTGGPVLGAPAQTPLPPPDFGVPPAAR